MIRYIRIENFKSMGDTTLLLGKFNCLIGLNGAGKSTILQALDFMSQLMVGDVSSWLDLRGWSSQELNCKLRKENNIKLTVGIETEKGTFLVWFASFNRNDLRCSTEAFACNDQVSITEDLVDADLPMPQDYIFRVMGKSYRLRGQAKKEITFNYQGSILSQLRDSELPEPILELRNVLRNIRSLELLSPHLMRKRARVNERHIGAGGEKLAGFLSNIKGSARESLLLLLKEFYPSLVDYRISNLRAGWKKLVIIEQFGERRLETDSTHLNDGLLRILAILAQTSSEDSLILLDEIENGINQELIQKLVNVLLRCPQQILITTHSPLVLNFLSEEEAKAAVQFVYKSSVGETKLRRFFEIPKVLEKLELMGPGDAFVDTNLVQLSIESNQLDEKEASDAVKKENS